VHRKHKYIGKNFATKFQLIAEKTAKDLGGEAIFAAPGISIVAGRWNEIL